MSSIYVCLAPGLEEVECLAVVDVLRRGGVSVTMASMGEELLITGSHNIRITTDEMWSKDAALACDAIFLPGGQPGTTNLTAHEELGQTLMSMEKDEKLICAICAAPSVLGKYGILNGKKATCYPGVEPKCIGAQMLPDGVVRDGQVITGRGLGYAIEEGLEILAALEGREISDKIRAAIQFPA